MPEPDAHPAHETPAARATRWLAEHGDVLYGFALRRLNQTADAEDAVQETLLGALQSTDAERQAGFRQAAAERTWLIGILRHKIYDILRKRRSEQGRIESLRAQASETAECFSGGYWRERQNQWALSADQLWASAEFRDFYQRCLDELPESLRLVYCLREIDGLDSETICEVMGITKTNLWTLTHRAKLELRRRISEWLEK